MTVQDWSDFELWLTRLNGQTIPTLQDFCALLEQEAGHNVYWRSGDRKAEKLEKLKAGFRYIKGHNLFREYQRIRQLCEIRQPSMAIRREAVRPPPTFGGLPARPVATPASGWRTSTAPNAYTRPPITMQNWRSTPCWKLVKALSPMELLTDITVHDTAQARREKRVSLALTAEDCALMNKGHQVRLFCTSSLHYRAPGSAGFEQYANLKPLPIDYPGTPEFEINNHFLPYTQRGLRNKPGSAPPFDLQNGPRGITPTPGKLWSVTFRHTGPSLNPKKKEEAKRFWFQLVLVEWTSKEQLLQKVDDLPVTDAKTSLAMIKSSQDDEIEAGSIRMSLKDPYSYMKVSRPVRSIHCKHQRCFDATWWIEQNVTHPEWLCPLCNKELNFEELMVDGYFKAIQQGVDDDVEEVVIEDDGEWHTADGKYGSDTWIKANGPEPAPKISRSPTPVLKRKAVMVLSSDDEDSSSKRPSARASSSRPASARPPSARPPMSRTTTNGQSEGIIDLTLSDDDEPPARAGPSRNAITSPPPLPSIRLRVPNPESRNLSPLRTDSWPDRDNLNYQLESILDRSYSEDEW